MTDIHKIYTPIIVFAAVLIGGYVVGYSANMTALAELGLFGAIGAFAGAHFMKGR